MIDVNNTFRIIEYCNELYILKRTSFTKGKKEVENAKRAFECIGEDCIVSNLNIHVVVPKIFNDEDCMYLVTKYYGYTMQSNLYVNIKTDVSLSTILQIQKMMYEKGILHRGFLPRNLILKDRDLYLIDWEDAIFFDSDNVENNLLCETNFVINWAYFFPNDCLTKCYLDNALNTNWNEPKLIDYENTLCSILDFNAENIADCRKRIKKFVAFAEQPLQYNRLMKKNMKKTSYFSLIYQTTAM